MSSGSNDYINGDGNVQIPGVLVKACIRSTPASITIYNRNGEYLVHDVGYLGQRLIGSPASIVMGAEIISYVKKTKISFPRT